MQITRHPNNHILTNAAVWSRDGRWIYYDSRSDAAGSVFDSDRVARVEVATGKNETVYRTDDGAKVGVVTASPVKDQVVFIHGPGNRAADGIAEDWAYSAHQRKAACIELNDGQSSNKHATTLDARDLLPPFTPGALRGGTHLHMFSPDGRWVSFTYEDRVLATAEARKISAQQNQRNVGVCLPVGPVTVPGDHFGNYDGSMFSVLVTRTSDAPLPGSDQINRAYSDAWIGTNGYRKPDGSNQHRAIAFLGDCVDGNGGKLTELFLVDIPDQIDTTQSTLCGTSTTRPQTPAGTSQRRLTFTAGRKHSGLSSIRHWPRSHPDGNQIAFLMDDDLGVPQVWTIHPDGTQLHQLTRLAQGVASAFTFRCDGGAIAIVSDNNVCEIDSTTGELTKVSSTPVGDAPPRPEAVVYSPDGTSIAFVRRLRYGGLDRNQIFVAQSSL